MLLRDRGIWGVRRRSSTARGSRVGHKRLQSCRTRTEKHTTWPGMWNTGAGATPVCSRGAGAVPTVAEMERHQNCLCSPGTTLTLEAVLVWTRTAPQSKNAKPTGTLQC